MLRIFYDSENQNATIVATQMSPEEIKELASKVLGARIEYVSKLKANQVIEEVPVVPDVTSSTTSDDDLPFDTTPVENIPSKTETPVKNEVVNIGTVITNPVPEDNAAPKFSIDMSVLDAPVQDAPDIFNNANAKTEEVPPVEEEYRFNFGKFNKKSIREALEFNSKDASSYLRWMFSKDIVSKRVANTESFVKEVLYQVKNFYSQHPISNEDELAEVASLLLFVIPENEREGILAIVDYPNSDKLFEAKNHEDNMSVKQFLTLFLQKDKRFMKSRFSAILLHFSGIFLLTQLFFYGII